MATIAWRIGVAMLDNGTEVRFSVNTSAIREPSLASKMVGCGNGAASRTFGSAVKDCDPSRAASAMPPATGSNIPAKITPQATATNINRPSTARGRSWGVCDACDFT
ncbi:unannotated protein [freshwater metagenome]|uniref:Unannotated protein n=1 Tax=freshwater metagenome TaxID=449393 RepID=A0A6J6IP38_9ZZZZ